MVCVRRHLFNLAATASLVLCTGTTLFLLVVLPARSPRNRSAVLQLRWPLSADTERTFDLCTYAGTVYVGTRLIGSQVGGDPFSVHTEPPARGRPNMRAS